MPAAADSLDVLVLRGGPDRERDVSLHSGNAVAAALERAGHRVTTGDLTPDDPSVLDRFVEHLRKWKRPGVVFPALHGKWGEGGGAQRLLEDRGVAYVGCRPVSADRCMDKWQTKRVLDDFGVPTPPYQLYDDHADAPTLDPPVVVKPNDDGSSIDLAICPDRETFDARFHDIAMRNEQVLIERFIEGKELTVGWVEGLGDPSSGGILPPIWIQPATAFYDYEAKYTRDDTAYVFDLREPSEVVARLLEVARQSVKALGVRHLCRVDVMLDAEGTPWVLEVNTMPGFTDHSLLPKAAAHAGTDMASLCDHLVRAALHDAR
ncbi:MAG: D-alanine--D-alanine ligase [Planctomycetota bacterium]